MLKKTAYVTSPGPKADVRPTDFDTNPLIKSYYTRHDMTFSESLNSSSEIEKNIRHECEIKNTDDSARTITTSVQGQIP